MVMLVHEPSEKAMVHRETPVTDSDSLHRLEVAPLI